MKKILFLLFIIFIACQKQTVHKDRAVSLSLQRVNIGTVANDGTGDPLRTAFSKVNTNSGLIENAFATVYTSAETRSVISDSIANIKVGIFNVLDYGALADATWTDGEGTCDSAAFQDAINAAIANDGGTVYVPTGDYLILESDGPIIIGAGVKIVCGAKVNFYVPADFEGIVFRIGSLSTTVQESGIKGGRIRMQSDGSVHTYTGIELKSTSSSYNVQRCFIEQTMVEGAGIAYNLVTEGTGWINFNTFNDINATECVSAFKIRESLTSSGIDHNIVNGFRIQVSAITEIIIDSISSDNNTLVNITPVDFQTAPSSLAGVLNSTASGNYIQFSGLDMNRFTDNGVNNSVICYKDPHITYITDRDAVAGVGTEAAFPIFLRNENFQTGEGTGIAFSNVSGAPNNIGAAIVFNRTDSYSKGKLEFYTKQSTGNTTAPVLIMTLNDDGRVLLPIALQLTPTASPPGGATEGCIYMDTDHHLYVYNGSNWIQLDN